MRSPLESPQQWLPVWLIGCGRLYQLVHVCYSGVYYVQNTITILFTHSAVDCGVPPSVSNGSPGAPSPDTMLNGMVTYTCDTGYEVSTGVTTAMATCMANRMWETVPTCSRMLCTVLCVLLKALFYSCGLWDTSTWDQCISWNTNHYNLSRNSDLHL